MVGLQDKALVTSFKGQLPRLGNTQLGLVEAQLRLGDEPQVEGGDETVGRRANPVAQRERLAIQALGGFGAEAFGHHHQRSQAQLQRQLPALHICWV